MLTSAIRHNARTYAQSNYRISTQNSARDTGIPLPHYPVDNLSKESVEKRIVNGYAAVGIGVASIFAGVGLIAGALVTGGAATPLAITGITGLALGMVKGATDIAAGATQAHRADRGHEALLGGDSGFGVATAYFADKCGATNPDRIGRNTNKFVGLALLATSAATSVATIASGAAHHAAATTFLIKSPTEARLMQTAALTLANECTGGISPSARSEPKPLSGEAKSPPGEARSPSEEAKSLSEQARDYDVSQHHLSSSWG
ncbi:hypothetical protein [Chromobacterium amazonense]|uniref:hypothetical protein n=1 Tax=Chromobacterium amazonense TaxID=1382803 RepID=UPI003F7B2FEC